MQFELRSVFGRVRIYPVSAEAKAVCEMLRLTTLPRDRLMYLGLMGITWHITPNGLDLDSAE
jgi:hypothetical protein